jgi:hypothetical protein
MSQGIDSLAGNATNARSKYPEELSTLGKVPTNNRLQAKNFDFFGGAEDALIYVNSHRF